MRLTREERMHALLNVWTGNVPWLTTRQIVQALPGVSYPRVVGWLREAEAAGLVECERGGGCNVWARTSAGRAVARGGGRGV